VKSGCQPTCKFHFVPACLQLNRVKVLISFFKDYVRASTIVHDFVHQYDKALNARYLKEKEKDVKTKTSRPILKTCYKMEVEAANVYIRNSFMMFQEELFSSQKYNSSKHREEGGTKIYRVTHHGRETPFYEVALEFLEKKATCTCHMFEFVGILCRHILHVFLKKNLAGIPQHYVLERWSINAKSRIIHGISSDEIEVETQNSSTLMRNSLKLKFDDVVELGSHSKKKYEHLNIALQNLRHELLTMNDDCDKDIEDGDVGSAESPVLNSQVLTNNKFILQDPIHVPCRGRPKALRQKHPIEKQPMKKMTCSICNTVGHVKSKCHSLKQTRYSFFLFLCEIL
jgi:hypothetical protein